MKNIKNVLIVAAIAAMTTSVMANDEDGVPILGTSYTEIEEVMVREGAKVFCASFLEFENREQCAMDYFTEHNYEGEPDCD
jgi:hypothetical protein